MGRKPVSISRGNENKNNKKIRSFHNSAFSQKGEYEKLLKA
jgi:hypothetical protein